jgi:catechol 2,3-dioxygenase-like lactoylglutathione lyase family enzyme
MNSVMAHDRPLTAHEFRNERRFIGKTFAVWHLSAPTARRGMMTRVARGRVAQEKHMRVTGTHHIALTTANFEQMKAFYVETLGLPLVGKFANRNIVFIDVGDTTIELIERKEGTPAVGGWDHFAFQVEDTNATYDELKALGIAFHVEPKDFPEEDPEVRIAFFKDPDGNILELVQPLAQRFPQNGME